MPRVYPCRKRPDNGRARRKQPQRTVLLEPMLGVIQGAIYTRGEKRPILDAGHPESTAAFQDWHPNPKEASFWKELCRWLMPPFASTKPSPWGHSNDHPATQAPWDSVPHMAQLIVTPFEKHRHCVENTRTCPTGQRPTLGILSDSVLGELGQRPARSPGASR